MNNSIIVTGASRGIGKAIALAVAENCTETNIKNFILIARNKTALKETEAEINAVCSDATTQIIVADFSSLNKVEKAINEAASYITGKVSIINNAGYTEPASIIETTNDNLEKTLTVNTMAPIVIVRELLKKGAEIKKIVNVASTAGMTPRPGWISYASSKAAVISLTTTMHEELISSGVEVFSISPGRCATDLRRTLAPEEDQSTIMQPEEVAKVVNQLLSPASAVMAGQNILLRKPVL